MNFMLIEWFDAWNGGTWQIIGFFSDLDEVKDALKTRRKDAKQKVLRVEVVTNLENKP